MYLKYSNILLITKLYLFSYYWVLKVLLHSGYKSFFRYMIWPVLREKSEKAMATHSNTLVWKIPWTEEAGGLQSMESHRVGHDWSDLAAAVAVGKSIQFSPLCLMLVVGVLQMSFIRSRKLLSNSSLLKVFFYEQCWILTMAFSESIEMLGIFASIHINDTRRTAL